MPGNPCAWDFFMLSALTVICDNMIGQKIISSKHKYFWTAEEAGPWGLNNNSLRESRSIAMLLKALLIPFTSVNNYAMVWVWRPLYHSECQRASEEILIRASFWGKAMLHINSAHFTYIDTVRIYAALRKKLEYENLMKWVLFETVILRVLAQMQKDKKHNPFSYVDISLQCMHVCVYVSIKVSGA